MNGSGAERTSQLTTISSAPAILPLLAGGLSRSSTEGFRVAMICMPFGMADRPSIQIGLLTAIAEEAGFETSAYHFNLDLAAQLSPGVYEGLCGHRGHMTGEWLFAPAAFGSAAPSDEHSFFEDFPEEIEWAHKIGQDPAFLVDLRRRVLPAFIESCLAAVEWSRYAVVGFSSTFQQNVASLALARRIKESYPDVVIVFGGANMEGEMGREYARAFPFIDYVVSGEGDRVFPALLHALASNSGPAAELPGLVARTPQGLLNGGPAAPIADLDTSPIPNYSGYFERAVHLGLLQRYKSTWLLPFETSRGCWWGQKHHCTFCGLNGLGMSYRAKSPQRVLTELSEQTRKYRINFFEAVDNILDLKYFEGFFDLIEQGKSDYQFFYEVKANLTRAQIHALYRGGMRHIQPGIESLSTHVLKLMRKGCSMLMNICCMKWCLYYGIHVSWNLLWGFPGETEEDYCKQLDVLKCIGHLEPPRAAGRIWLERFSPYYTDASFPVRNVRPESSYRYVYPEYVDLGKAAYFFDYDMGDTVSAAAHVATQSLVRDWQEHWHSDKRHALNYRRTSDVVLIDYNWGPDRRGTYTLFGALASIYEFCVETMHTADQVVRHLRSSPEGYDYPVEEVGEALDEFCRAHLMLAEDGKYLSLAIPSNPNW
jgi:ribosomal peptide maturation radical SAM protein 1